MHTHTHAHTLTQTRIHSMYTQTCTLTHTHTYIIHMCIRLHAHTQSQVTSSKNEVILEFHQSEEAPLSLVEMRFHIPNITTHTGEEGAEVEEDEGSNPVKLFHSKVLAKADVIQATGDAIVTFAEIHTLTPRLVTLSLLSLDLPSSLYPISEN